MKRPEDWLPQFPEEQIPRILSIVERCASRLQKTHPLEKENDLSDRLRDLIDLDPEFQDSVDAELFRETCIYDRKKPRQRQLGRGDITFLAWAEKKPWPYFLIEAKRLHVTFPSGWDSLVPEYVTGSQGMMCFIEERYCRGLSSGAMLGYVFDGQTQKARGAIATQIKKHSPKLQSMEPHTLSPSGLPGTTAEHSIHSIRGQTFVIYHLFAAV